MEPPIQTEYLEIFDASQDLCLIIFVLSYSLSLWWSNGLDLHGGGGEGGDLLLHPVRDAGVHGGASGEDDVGVEVLPDVHVALHDGVVGGLVHPAALHPDERRLEQGLWGPEPLVADCDNLRDYK